MIKHFKDTKNMKKWNWLINFQDPASPFFFNLLSVHHDVIWYILIILVFVYWCLAQILREFGWNIFNKKKGLFRIIFHLGNLIDIQAVFSFLWVTFAVYLNGSWYLFCSLCRKLSYYFFNINFFIAIIGKNAFRGKNKSKQVWVNYWNYEYINKNLVDQNVHSWLYGVTCRAMYFYDFVVLVRNIRKFKHSFNLELIWAFFSNVNYNSNFSTVVIFIVFSWWRDWSFINC